MRFISLKFGYHILKRICFQKYTVNSRIEHFFVNIVELVR